MKLKTQLKILQILCFAVDLYFYCFYAVGLMKLVMGILLPDPALVFQGISVIALCAVVTALDIRRDNKLRQNLDDAFELRVLHE